MFIVNRGSMSAGVTVHSVYVWWEGVEEQTHVGTVKCKYPTPPTPPGKLDVHVQMESVLFI